VARPRPGWRFVGPASAQNLRGRNRQRTSTRRRITPVLVQGASSKILSKEFSANPGLRPVVLHDPRVRDSQPNEIIAQPFQAQRPFVTSDERAFVPIISAR